MGASTSSPSASRKGSRRRYDEDARAPFLDMGDDDGYTEMSHRRGAVPGAAGLRGVDDDGDDGRASPPPAAGGFRRRGKGGKRRYCWGGLSACQFWTLVALAVAAAVMAVLVLVVGRAVAQHKLDGAGLIFRSMHISDPAARAPGEGCGSYRGPVSLNTTVCIQVVADSDTSVPVDTVVSPAWVSVLADTAPLAGGLYGGYTPPFGAPARMEIGRLYLPRQSFSAGETPRLEADTAMELVNEPLFTAYNLYLVNTTSAPWSARASLDVRVSWWMLSVPYNGLSFGATMSVPGFDGVRNVTVDSFDLPRNAPDGRGVEVVTNATLYNPGMVSVDLPATVVDLYYEGVPARIGRVRMAPMRLVPGYNPLYTVGVVDPPQAYAQRLTPFFSAYVTGGTSVVTVRGVAPVDAASEPVWVRRLVAGVAVALPVRSLMDIDLVRSITATDLGIDFVPRGGGRPVLSANVSSTFQNPFGFPIQILRASLVSRLLDVDGSGRAVGLVRVPPTDVDSRMGDPAFDLRLAGATVEVLDEGLFETAVRGVIERPNLVLRAWAVANVTFASAMGVLSVEGVPLKHPLLVPVQGLDDFAGVTVTNGAIGSADGASATEVRVSATAAFTSPGTVTAEVGDLKLDLVYGSGRDGVVLGTATVDSASLRPGATQVSLSASLRTDTVARQAAMTEFGSRYVTRQAIQLSVRGRPDSTPVGVLEPALNGLEVPLSFRPPDYAFVVSARLWVGLPVLKVRAYIQAFNPLPVTAQLNGLQFDIIDDKGRDVYTMHSQQRVEFGSGHRELELDAPLSGFHLSVLKDAMKAIHGDTMPVSIVKGSVDFTILPNFRQTVTYKTPGTIGLKVEFGRHF